jgi:hypothetical protein
MVNAGPKPWRQRVSEKLRVWFMPPLDASTAKPRSKRLDRALSLIAALVIAAIVVVARY